MQALEAVVVTNTLPLNAEVQAKTQKIELISVGPVLAETIRRLHTGESLADLKESMQDGEVIQPQMYRSRL
jgi:ribose-phosphate pyrophosphokinase